MSASHPFLPLRYQATLTARAWLPLSTRAALASLLARYQVIVVPGWNNSGPGHWQTHWENEFPALQRVRQKNWAAPDPVDWVDTLDQTIRRSRKPVVLVAHSLGCITVARWAMRNSTETWPVVGALLVAPADVERSDVAPALRPFAPIAHGRLPFVSHVVGSNNDPCCSEVRARELASHWGAAFSLVRDGGHINADSGLGGWPQGLSMLAWMTTSAREH